MKKIKSSELMMYAENNMIKEGYKFIDQDGNIIIFSGKSFYSADKERFWGLIESERVTCFCIDDLWEKYKGEQ